MPAPFTTLADVRGLLQDLPRPTRRPWPGRGRGMRC